MLHHHPSKLRPLRRRGLALLCALAGAATLQCTSTPVVAQTPSTIALHDGYVQGCGAVIYYKTLGRGRPLIVLHGGPGSTHQYFLPYLLPLAAHRQLVFLDERGSGRSQRLAHADQYTLTTMACDIDALRSALKLGVTDVLGHSFGGILAQAYAIKYPNTVRRLILSGTGSSAARLNTDFARIKQDLDPGLRAQIDALEAKGIIGPDGAQLPQYRKLADEAELPFNYVVRPPVWSGGGEDLGWDVLNEMWGAKSDFHIDGNLAGFDFVPELHRLSMPVLILAGDHDLPSTATLAETHTALSGSQLVIFKRSGHMAFVDQNEAFIDTVEKFLDQ